MQEELLALRGEVEPISSRRGSQSRAEGGAGTVTYRPTYRAILAKHNYLVRKTLGNGSYSKVKLAISLSRNKEAVAIKIVDRLVHEYLPTVWHAMALWFTHSLAHSLTRSLAHSLAHSLTGSLIDSLTGSLTDPLTHSLTHSLMGSLTHWLTH